jgi:hypothetical protein
LFLVSGKDIDVSFLKGSKGYIAHGVKRGTYLSKVKLEIGINLQRKCTACWIPRKRNLICMERCYLSPGEKEVE